MSSSSGGWWPPWWCACRHGSAADGGGEPGGEPGISIGGTGPAAGNGYEIILQCFNWDSHKTKPSWYHHLHAEAKRIGQLGFTAAWLPPPTNSVSPQGYLPRDLYDLNSAYGTEAELRELLAALRELRIKSVADIVINHRCAHEQKNGKWNQFGGRLAWDETAICSDNPEYGGRGAHGTGEDYPAAPNIDHTNQKVREDLQGWLKHLRKVGYDGWRFDYVKGYSGEFTRKYIDASVPLLAFGEYWDSCSYTGGVLDYNQDGHRQRTVNWCDKTGGTSAAFDFTTKGILQEAVGRSEYWRLSDSKAQPPGVIGMWSTRAVTFVENHDTGSTLGHWPFPPGELMQGYCYILTHPGTPCVFWDHAFMPGLGEKIQELIALRKANGLNAKSQVVVLKATADCYAACIDGKVVMKIGGGEYSPNTFKVGNIHWSRICEGRNFAVRPEAAALGPGACAAAVCVWRLRDAHGISCSPRSGQPRRSERAMKTRSPAAALLLRARNHDGGFIRLVVLSYCCTVQILQTLILLDIQFYRAGVAARAACVGR